MEYLKTQEYHTRIDVYFDGEKYVFINAFHGCVAIARREGLVEFTNDGFKAHVKFKVEKTIRTISKKTIACQRCPYFVRYDGDTILCDY